MTKMKKIISLMVVFVLCLCMTLPVFAAEDTFVPSISEKDGPTLVPTKDENGKTVYGRIVKDGEVIDHIEEGCLVITSVSKAEEIDQPHDDLKLLLEVYEQLKNGTMKIPFEKFSPSMNADNMVIRELVDVSWSCLDHPEVLAQDGVSIEVTFNLGVSADTEVCVMSYKEGEWNPPVKTVNNGDGTVTCEFESFCPVAFAVPTGVLNPVPQPKDNGQMILWIVLMCVVVVAGIVAVVILRRKSAQKKG